MLMEGINKNERGLIMYNAMGALQNGSTFNIFAREKGEWSTGKWMVLQAVRAANKQDAISKLKFRVPNLKKVDETIYRGDNKEYYVSEVS